MFESRRPDVISPEHERAGVQLVIGNRRTSSWSLVAWLALHQADVTCAVEEIDLHAPDSHKLLAAASPTGRVPVLVDHGTTIWDSLAIMEWAAERAPALWPAHARRRAVARSVVAELHAGFHELRSALPMDWFARYSLKGTPSPRVTAETKRLVELMEGLLAEGDGTGFLFGARPMLPDLAMVAMVGRLRTYGLLPTSGDPASYVIRVLELPALEAWFRGVEPAPALPAPPPGVASPEATAARVMTGTSPAAAMLEPARAAGAKRLEDVVARARERDRPGSARPTPDIDPSSAPAAPRGGGRSSEGRPADLPIEPPSPEPGATRPAGGRPPSTTRPPETAHPTAEPTAADDQPPTRGLPWLRRRQPSTPPDLPPLATGSRRRPPRRD